MQMIRQDKGLQELVNRISEQVGLGPFEVRVEPGNDFERVCPVSVTRHRLTIYERPWSRLSGPEREFGLTQAMITKSIERAPWQGFHVLWQITLFSACIAASQNLWLIIPMHSLGLLAWFAIPWLLYKWTTIEADQRALAVTKNLGAAVRYIQATTSYAPPWLSLEARLNALRVSAG